MLYMAPEATPVIPDYLLAFDETGIARGGTWLEALKASDPARYATLISPDRYNYAKNQIVKSADTDWFDEVFNPAPVKNIQLSAAGGSDKGSFVVAFNYYDQKQTSDEYSYYKRYTGRANSTFNIKNIIKMGENMQVSYSEGRDVGRPGSAWTMPSILPVWDIMGNPTGGFWYPMFLKQMMAETGTAQQARHGMTVSISIITMVFLEICSLISLFLKS